MTAERRSPFSGLFNDYLVPVLVFSLLLTFYWFNLNSCHQAAPHHRALGAQNRGWIKRVIPMSDRAWRFVGYLTEGGAGTGQSSDQNKPGACHPLRIRPADTSCAGVDEDLRHCKIPRDRSDVLVPQRPPGLPLLSAAPEPQTSLNCGKIGKSVLLTRRGELHQHPDLPGSS